jgi:hypothetical protein
MSDAVDQQVVEALVPQRAAYRSAKAFARDDRTGVLMIRTPLPANADMNSLSRPRISNLR